MTIPGAGGQVPQRPDQATVPSQPPVVSPGSPQVVRAQQVIVYGPSGRPVGVFVYAAGTTPGLGNEPVASMTNQSADPFGNPTESGVAGYVTIAGTTYALQLGLGSFAGTPAAAFFLHNITSPPNSDPMFGGFASPSGAAAQMYSGQATGGSAGSGIEAEDSTASGVPNGTVNVIAGQLLFQGAVLFDGTTLDCIDINVGNGSIGGANINLNPLIATPPNYAAVSAGTATNAQIQACLAGIITSLMNRGMVNP